MPTTDTSVSNLIVNKLTLSQYKTAKAGGQIVDTESYEITDIDTAFIGADTKYAANLDLTINSSTYVITAQLKDQDGNAIGNERTIDLPLESVVVNGTYDNTNKKIILTLNNGNTIDIPVGDLVSGLQTEITSTNKLDADLVDDSTSTNKFVTASDKTTWSAKQDALVSGTNIKTVNNTSLLGSGDITIDSLPAQTGQSGKFLTTDGTDASWATVDALPSQTGQTGKFLTTDGSAASWADVDALPDQTGQSGKFLTTNGTTASWAEASVASVTPDNKSIGKNTANALQAIGIIDQNNPANALGVWHGTQAEYDALATHDANTRYYTDGGLNASLLDVLYPVGSIYITTNTACPLSTLIAGSTWEPVGQDRVLQGAGLRGVVGTTLNESLPNIKGGIIGGLQYPVGFSGALYSQGLQSTKAPNADWGGTGVGFDASLSSSTYQDNAPVQPDAYLVNIYRRIS